MQDMETYLEEVNGELVIKQDVQDKLSDLRKQKDQLEREIKTLSSGITNELKTHYTETQKVGGYNFVAKGGYFDFVFDLDTFKNDHFDIYCQYLVPHETKITYSLVSAIREKKDVQ